jgi:hypothetical protein
MLVQQEKMTKLRDLASLALTTFAASGTRLSVPTSSHGSETAMALSLGATTRTIARPGPEAGGPSLTSMPSTLDPSKVYQSSASLSPSHSSSVGRHVPYGTGSTHDTTPPNALYNHQQSFPTSIPGASSDPSQTYGNVANPEPRPDYSSAQGSLVPLSRDHPQGSEHHDPTTVWQATDPAFSGMDDVMEFAFMHGFLSSPEDVRLLQVDPGANTAFTNFDHSSLSTHQFAPIGFQSDLTYGYSFDGSPSEGLTRWNRLMTEV